MSTRDARAGLVLRNVRLISALALAGVVQGAWAADGDVARLRAELRSLAERFTQLERRNQELEKRFSEPTAAARPAPAADAAPIEARVRALEDAQVQTEQALQSERLSENEPELVTRLKAIETQTLAMQKPARQMEALDGIVVEGNLVGVLQHVNAGGSEEGRATSRLNYRGDVAVTLPGGEFGNAEGTIHAQLRFGQGEGVALRPTFTGTGNSSTFQVAGVTDPDSSFAVLAQAWYQLTVPLPLDGYKPYSRQHFELTVGKMDPFVFFDQNEIADDETARFLNNAFVHNPLLDSGGDVGVDAYGFTPGVRVGWFDDEDKAATWGVSLGVFGSGDAANFSGSLGQPCVIGQVEFATRLLDGLPGHYRVYGWRNGRAEGLDQRVQAHAGWGVSIDQRVSDSLALFGRWGRRASGDGEFGKALTLGAELSGNGWGRAADAVGFAGGLLRTSDAYRRTADGSAASGNERIAELYYRIHLNEHVEISPDLQWIRRPGGDGSAPDVKLIGVRASAGF